MRITSKWVLGGVAVAALAFLFSPALGGDGGGNITLTLVGGEGEAGQDAGVSLELANDDGSAVSAGLDIVFSADDLTFTEPVSTSCVLDASIAGTHQLAGRIIEPGVVNVEILVAGTPDPLPTLGNGPLAVCNFTIRGDAEVDDMFPVAATEVFIGDALGLELTSEGVDGVITVVGGGTPTATATDTPEPATPTATATPTIGCVGDEMCPTGMSCQDGSCKPIDCTDDSDCPPGSTCDLPASTSGGGPIGQCVPVPCDTDDDCPDRSVCDPDGMCRPEFCDENDDCDPDDVCASDGICSSDCDDDIQCDDGVCVDGTCVECRDDNDCSGGVCVDNECVADGFSLAVSPESQPGVAGGSAAVEVVLSSDATSAAADMVSNSLAVDTGLTIQGCQISTASAVIPGEILGAPGTTVSATLGGPAGSVPTGTLYTCNIAIAGDAAGSLAVNCGDAKVNGLSVSCSSAVVSIPVPPTPTSTPTATATFTATATRTEVPPTNTPQARGFDDDGCAVGPASQSSDATSVLFLLVPALLLWSRRRS